MPATLPGSTHGQARFTPRPTMALRIVPVAAGHKSRASPTVLSFPAGERTDGGAAEMALVRRRSARRAVKSHRRRHTGGDFYSVDRPL